MFAQTLRRVRPIAVSETVFDEPGFSEFEGALGSIFCYSDSVQRSPPGPMYASVSAVAPLSLLTA